MIIVFQCSRWKGVTNDSRAGYLYNNIIRNSTEMGERYQQKVGTSERNIIVRGFW